MPDIEEIKERMGGNICRCTGYTKIFEAVEIARDVIAGELPASAAGRGRCRQSYIGNNVRRLDAPSKVTGRAEICRRHGDAGHAAHAGAAPPACRMRSSKSIDISAAEALPGVACVITADDVPGEDGFGVFVHDQPVMARGKVRYVGEAVAAVAADDVLTAMRARIADQG